jgi:prevent-host-death family protein
LNYPEEVKRVTRTELNQQTARVLARVAAGERLIITDRGRPVAELVPPSSTKWDELIESGAVTPASRRGPLTFAPRRIDGSSAEILDEIRADRM